MEYYNDTKNCGAIAIILTHAMIKDSQGLFFLLFVCWYHFLNNVGHVLFVVYSVSNEWSGSKLLINEDIPEITEFLSK